MFTFSKAFKSSTVSASFDEVIERDAHNGRIPHALLLAVSVDYNTALPATPREFVVTLNRDYLTGEGKATLAPLVQTLHACAVAIISGGKVKNLPALLPLPAWADPVSIQARKNAASAKRTAAKFAAEVVPESVPESVSLDSQTEVVRIVELVKSGAFSAEQLESLQLAILDQLAIV